MATESDNACTSEALDVVLGQLSPEQIRYAIARREAKSVTDAAAAVGMARQSYYKWPEEERAQIDEAVRLMARDGLVTAMHLRRRALAEAMAVKVAGLRSRDERVRQATATELIEWELGKATQRSEVTGKGGEALVIEYVNDWRGRGAE
ncbi:MAG: hypothetical protein WC977_08970 [Anaerovoracaceae bacterium]